jgi:hypothetical protein
MNNKPTYTELLNHIRSTEPVLHHPHDFKAEIMKRINDREPAKKIQFIQWLRPVLSAAAVFMVGLFVYLQLNNQPSIALNTAVVHNINANQSSGYQINQSNFHTMLNQTKSPGYLASYRQWQKAQRSNNLHHLIMMRVNRQALAYQK